MSAAVKFRNSPYRKSFSLICLWGSVARSSGLLTSSVKHVQKAGEPSQASLASSAEWSIVTLACWCRGHTGKLSVQQLTLLEQLGQASFLGTWYPVWLQASQGTWICCIIPGPRGLMCSLTPCPLQACSHSPVSASRPAWTMPRQGMHGPASVSQGAWSGRLV